MRDFHILAETILCTFLIFQIFMFLGWNIVCFPPSDGWHFRSQSKLQREPIFIRRFLVLSLAKYNSSQMEGDCWDVRQCFVRQFKTDYVPLVEGLVFEKKKFFGDR